MSIRLRLALTYGGLSALVILLLSLLTYSVHAHGSYDEVDSSLVASVDFLLLHDPSTVERVPQMEPITGPFDSSIVLRVYDKSGKLVGQSVGSENAPAISPGHVYHTPSGAAPDPIVALAPSMAGRVPDSGVFGIVRTADGTRWRVLVVPEPRSGGYYASLSALDQVDSSVERLRWLMAGLVGLGALLTFFGGGLIAGRALRPVADMTNTAAGIARFRNLSERVASSDRQDELGRLAATFNQMLDSIEQAYAAQNRFVADASHELRAPITAIQGNLELLQRQACMPPEDRAEAIDEASREAARLSRLVADLLMLARADAGVPLRCRAVELDRLLLEAVSDARHLARGQEIRIEAIEPVQLSGDPDRLKQVILILLDNALKYTPVDGRVTASLQSADGRAELVIADNGAGIAAEDLPHIFERFYRADPARSHDPGGTGLGLSIAKWIVDQHSGVVKVMSHLGQGTTITVELPTS